MVAQLEASLLSIKRTLARQSSLRHLPEETFPGREVGSLEQRVFQNTFHSAQSLNHVGPVVVQIPQLAVMSLVGPPERILLENLKAAKEGDETLEKKGRYSKGKSRFVEIGR